MRIVRRKELRDLVGYSPAHIDRLEKAGQFPKRVELGPSAVGWVDEELQEWIKARIAERDAADDDGDAAAAAAADDEKPP